MIEVLDKKIRSCKKEGIRKWKETLKKQEGTLRDVLN